MERILIGAGNEHEVFQSKKPGYVIKRPHIYSRFMSSLFRINPMVVSKEYTQSLTNNSSGILLPETRIFIFKRKRGYLIYQRYIEEDNSVNISEYLKSKNLWQLFGRYERNPDNFASNNSSVYLLDFTHGFRLTGILDRKGILPLDTFLWWKRRLKQIFKE